jgi:hypothetical protein
VRKLLSDPIWNARAGADSDAIQEYIEPVECQGGEQIISVLLTVFLPIADEHSVVVGEQVGGGEHSRHRLKGAACPFQNISIPQTHW